MARASDQVMYVLINKKMSKNFSKILIAVAVVTIVALPFVAMAAGLQLETTFPKAPSMQEIVTGRTQLPGIIRYVVDWTIIIAALVTVLALVMAGIAYLTSRGRPEATKAAKDRIKNCIYGLLIIAGSFLVLQTINPQLTIMTIQKKPVTGGGVVMFTQAGLYGNGNVNGCSNAPAICTNPEAVFGFNQTNGDTLEILIKAGAARYLNYDIANTITEFGKLTKGADGYVASADFPLYGLGFFGDVTGQAEAKVFAFPDIQFNVSSEDKAKLVIEYRPGGKIKQDGSVERVSEVALAGSPAGELKMTIINIYQDYANNFNSTVSYYNPSANPPADEKKALPHPPLSIRMQSGGTGVVLFADNGAMKNLSATVEDFNLSNVKFDNQADKIELRNYTVTQKDGNSTYDRTHNFLAILHSGYFFTGDVRYFFEKIGFLIPSIPTYAPVLLRLPRIYQDKSFWNNSSGFLEQYTVSVDLTKLETDPKYFGDGASGASKDSIGRYCGVGDCKGGTEGHDLCKDAYCAGKMLGEPSSGYTIDKAFFYPSEPLSGFGNIVSPVSFPIPAFNKKSVNEIDQFGRLRANDKASSIELFELEEFQGIYGTDTNLDKGDEPAIAAKQKIVCREVKLCTSKGYMGDCLVFVPNTPDYIKGKFVDKNRYDSIVLPMPFYAPINIPVDLTGWVKTYDDKGATVIKDKKIEFANKIKSIGIEGDCAVILFENSAKDDECYSKCASEAKCDGCWDGGGPGANSEVFTSSVTDLSTHEISKCGGREKFGFGERKNCASSIAIFPIRRVNEQQGQ